MGYLDFISLDDVKKLRKTIENNLSDELSFEKVSELPKDKGVYFIYDKKELVYIGESGSGEIQTIRERCRQNVNRSSGGTFRDKLMKDKGLTKDTAIIYIKNNCSIRYIIENEHKKMEHLAIGLFNTKYND